MRTRNIFLIIVMYLFCIILSACTASNAQTGPKREVHSYSERTLKFEYTPELYFTNDAGDIEIYTWDKCELKIEITKRVRGIGEDNVMLKRLNDFIICIKEDKKKIIFESNYKGKIRNSADQSLDLKIFIPKKTRIMGYELGAGSIRILDDIKGVLNMRLDAASVAINRFDGILNIKGGTGNICMDNGTLEGNTSVIESMGNISIRSAFDRSGNYTFKTDVGNIDLMIPKNSKVNFENTGDVKTDEFKSDSLSPKIKTHSSMGRISIREY